MSLQMVLWAVWGAVTLCFVGVMVWKSMSSMGGEHDIVVLDETEQKHAAEVQVTIKKMEKLTLMAKRFGLASLALLVINGAIIVYNAIKSAYGSAVQY